MSKSKEYWMANLRLVVLCIIIWFVVSFGFGVGTGLFDGVSFGMLVGGGGGYAGISVSTGTSPCAASASET